MPKITLARSWSRKTGDATHADYEAGETYDVSKDIAEEAAAADVLAKPEAAKTAVPAKPEGEA